MHIFTDKYKTKRIRLEKRLVSSEWFLEGDVLVKIEGKTVSYFAAVRVARLI